jgi:hypothetical protein
MSGDILAELRSDVLRRPWYDLPLSVDRNVIDRAAAEIERLRAQTSNLRNEGLEQSRLLGMAANREASLRARVAVLERVREAALPHLFNHSMETGRELLKALQGAYEKKSVPILSPTQAEEIRLRTDQEAKP